MDEGLLSDIVIGIVLSIRSSPFSTSLPVLACTGTAPVALGVVVAAQHGTWTWNDCCLAGNVRNSSTVIRFNILEFSRTVPESLMEFHPLLQLVCGMSCIVP